MEHFITHLAVAVVPFIALIALVILADISTRRRKLLRLQRTRIAARRAFAAAADHKWL